MKRSDRLRIELFVKGEGYISIEYPSGSGSEEKQVEIVKIEEPPQEAQQDDTLEEELKTRRKKRSKSKREKNEQQQEEKQQLQGQEREQPQEQEQQEQEQEQEQKQTQIVQTTKTTGQQQELQSPQDPQFLIYRYAGWGYGYARHIFKRNYERISDIIFDIEKSHRPLHYEKLRATLDWLKFRVSLKTFRKPETIKNHIASMLKVPSSYIYEYIDYAQTNEVINPPSEYSMNAYAAKDKAKFLQYQKELEIELELAILETKIRVIQEKKLGHYDNETIRALALIFSYLHINGKKYNSDDRLVADVYEIYKTVSLIDDRVKSSWVASALAMNSAIAREFSHRGLKSFTSEKLENVAQAVEIVKQKLGVIFNLNIVISDEVDYVADPENPLPNIDYAKGLTLPKQDL